MTKINSFKDLIIWQLSIKLFEMVVTDIEKFPNDRTSRVIGDQILRSLSSISALIAEGSGRGGKKELIRYLIMARGSLTESQDWIYKLTLIRYITEKRKIEYEEIFEKLRIKINALIGKSRV